MRRLTTIVLAGIMLTVTLAHASGDLIVDGNVGIGTSTPSARLQIYPTTGGGNLKLSDYATVGTTYSSWSTIIGNNVKASESNADQMESIVTHPTYAGSAISLNGAGGIVFHTKSGQATAGEVYTSPRMAITSSGNVGIGTLNPASKIHITGAINSGYAAAIENIGTTYAGGLYINISDSSTGQPIRIDKGNIPVFQILNNGNVMINGTVTASNGLLGPSDITFKKNLQPINDSLSKVLKLEGLSYEWKIEEFKDKGFSEGRHYGVIAQEIEKVLPEVVTTASDGTKAVAYTEIIPVLIEAIKEQQKEIEELKRLIHAK